MIEISDVIGRLNDALVDVNYALLHYGSVDARRRLSDAQFSLRSLIEEAIDGQNTIHLEHRPPHPDNPTVAPSPPWKRRDYSQKHDDESIKSYNNDDKISACNSKDTEVLALADKITAYVHKLPGRSVQKSVLTKHFWRGGGVVDAAIAHLADLNVITVDRMDQGGRGRPKTTISLNISSDNDLPVTGEEHDAAHNGGVDNNDSLSSPKGAACVDERTLRQLVSTPDLSGCFHGGKCQPKHHCYSLTENANPLKVLPPSDYVVQIVHSETETNQAGTGSRLRLEMEVLEGECAGQRLIDYLELWNPNQKAVEIANRTLSAICHATGVMVVEDAEQLHFHPMLAKVVVKPPRVDIKSGEKLSVCNEVNGYKPYPPPNWHRSE